MSSGNFRVRRATLDDLDVLRPMWESMRFQVPELERRLTEFQVAEDADGRIVGTLGFQIVARHARVHSEAYSDFAAADMARPLFWDRLKALSMNHGIVRLWTQESVPFWKQNGFLPTNADTLKRLPEVWKEASGEWFTLPLKNEESLISLEKELAMFMAAEKQRTDRAFQHARTLKMIATALAVIFAIFVAGALFYMVRKNPGLLIPHR